MLRLQSLAQRLSESGVDAAVVLLSRDIYYFTGTAQPCILLVTPSDYFLFVRRALDFVVAETWIDPAKIIDGGNFKDVLLKLNEIGVHGGRLGLEMDILPVELFFKIMGIFSGFDPVDISGHIMTQRMSKDAEEIGFIKTACEIMKKGHDRVLTVLREGMTELELAAEVEYAHRRGGHEGVLSMRNFDFYISRGPLASGENLFRVSGFSNTVTGVGLSPAVPAGPSSRVIKNGDLVIVDIPTCHRGYHCDETRTFVLGRARPEVAELFKALREISDRVIDSLGDGIRCGEVFETARSCAQELGVEEYFLGLAPRKGNFIGHGIGLDANEAPVLFARSDFVLRRNFVVTVEIHLTHPRHGAVKLEDMVLIRDRGAEVLSLTARDLFCV